MQRRRETPCARRRRHQVLNAEALAELVGQRLLQPAPDSAAERAWKARLPTIEVARFERALEHVYDARRAKGDLVEDAVGARRRERARRLAPGPPPNAARATPSFELFPCEEGASPRARSASPPALSASPDGRAALRSS